MSGKGIPFLEASSNDELHFFISEPVVLVDLSDPAYEGMNISTDSIIFNGQLISLKRSEDE